MRFHEMIGLMALFLAASAVALAAPKFGEGRPIGFEAPEYEPLIGGNFVGSGFHFESRGERFIACSLHQTDGESPDSMISMDVEGGVTVTDRVAKGHDAQVLRYDCPQLDEIPALVFNPDAETMVGDPVYLYNDDGPAVGHIIRARKNHRRVVRMRQPFAAAGMSGSPVINAATGSVIGVLLDANNPQAATVVGFELLPKW